MSETESLPLFPLHTVLLPGGALGLRVFERRYLDLVRECGRSGRGFGVCLILEGEEAGRPATPAAYGTEATIEDFGTDNAGLLTLRLRGRRRFHVQRTRVRDNGLMVGQVRWCAADGDDELRPEHGLLATVLEKIFEKAGATPPDMRAADLDNAAWVGWRLAELLPLSAAQRLALLQEDDPHARLDRLLELMA
ncbi:MAG: LON peptidase substrate-binding domain-containing protein [Pseudoxanthomonas sp.]